jgi:hypothetical protein
MSMFSREARRQGIEAMFADPAAIADALGDISVPADIAAWLGRLLTLAGVPFGYLVPDEVMLPPESIRFFRLNETWIRALLDGAFSLGRNLTAAASGASANLDRVLIGPVAVQARAAAPRRTRRPAGPRARAAAAARSAAAAGTGSAGTTGGTGTADGTGGTGTTGSTGGTGTTGGTSGTTGTNGTADTPWTGFLLRSRVVTAYPGLGVNVYAKGQTPDDPVPVLMPVRRLDRLGPAGDTLLCLVEGDAYRVDVHEAPELLHYGIDVYDGPASPGGPPHAVKNLHTFSRAADGTITFTQAPGKTPAEPVIVQQDISSCFRTRSPRVLRFTDLAGAIATANSTSEIDSAQMGFEMTEGVGMVSFINRDAP